MSAKFKQTSHAPDWILWLLAVGLVFALGTLMLMALISDGPTPSDEPAAAVPAETTPQPTATVEATATVESTPDPTATMEATAEPTATVEPTPAPTSTPEPAEPIPTPQPTLVPEPTATPESKPHESPWLDWTFAMGDPIYMPKIGKVVELPTGSKFVIHEIIREEGSESKVTRDIRPDESIILVDVQAWNPTDPKMPPMNALLTIEAVYGENAYGEYAVWFLLPVNEEPVTGGPAYADPSEPGQSVRGWMGVVVSSKASLHAMVWIIYDVDGDNDAIIVWMLEPGL